VWEGFHRAFFIEAKGMEGQVTRIGLLRASGLDRDFKLNIEGAGKLSTSEHEWQCPAEVDLADWSDASPGDDLPGRRSMNAEDHVLLHVSGMDG
jgi:xylose isomerase